MAHSLCWCCVALSRVVPVCRIATVYMVLLVLLGMVAQCMWFVLKRRMLLNMRTVLLLQLLTDLLSD